MEANLEPSSSRNIGGIVRGIIPNLPTIDSTLQVLGQSQNVAESENMDAVIIDVPGSNEQDENDNTRGGQQNGAGAPGGPRSSLADLRIAASWAEKTIPFLIVLLLKVIVDHRLGLIVLIGLFGTFIHYNGSLKRQVALKEKRRLSTLILMMAFLPLNIFFIYYVFDEQHLQNCLLFMKPDFDEINLWDLLWIIGITDYIIKFISIAAKCFIAMTPRTLIGFKRRGKYYLLIELTSQLYRLLTPVPIWCAYLRDDTYSHWIIGYSLVFIYILAKVRTVFQKLGEVGKAWKNLFTDVHYGNPPSKEQILAAGSSCPICQEDYAQPVMLHTCKHIFCEECVSIWFDRERTCPMCRAKIAEDPSWKDGATAAYMQLY
ncbi:E3 ubiquitin-protein ligase RNFT2-like [Ptychodera flava]|uniref:E3 ubiquitin-protein ligase RNFT2-like n=1 Tax=Ptychodera flava TaxID=63121 RepID=UPI00396A249C